MKGGKGWRGGGHGVFLLGEVLWLGLCAISVLFRMCSRSLCYTNTIICVLSTQALCAGFPLTWKNLECQGMSGNLKVSGMSGNVREF